jgi:hypothetical protein
VPLENPFGIDSLPPVFVFPTFTDLDNDGDFDLFMGTPYGDTYNVGEAFLFYENTGTANSPSFDEPLVHPFGLEPPYGFAMPAFADIDDDGDLDLFTGEYYGMIKFYENTGDNSAPAFEPGIINPFGLTGAYLFAFISFSDIDHDGDLDLFAGEYYGNFLYYENIGHVEAPAFASPVTNPFGLQPTYYFNFPVIADLDDDGDDDILSTEYYGTFEYFENTEINTGLSESNKNPFFELSPNPTTDEVVISLADDDPGHLATVQILDLNGKLLKSTILSTIDYRLSTIDLPPGVYIVKLIRKDKVYTKKLVVR